jgi:hypothetical protein
VLKPGKIDYEDEDYFSEGNEGEEGVAFLALVP